jgi:hypothetical protein
MPAHSHRGSTAAVSLLPHIRNFDPIGLVANYQTGNYQTGNYHFGGDPVWSRKRGVA